jgi:hypothetical protein
MGAIGGSDAGVGDLIAILALGTSIFGLIVPWWQAGHAQLDVHFERWFDAHDKDRRYRAVVVNRGGGTANDVSLGVPIDDKSADQTRVDLGVIYPGQELYLELVGASSFSPLTEGLVRWRDGRVERARMRKFLVTIKDLV